MHSKEVRQTFIDFFIEKGHTFAKGSPVVPQDDPTLLFINAGMNQFKDVFLGTGTRDYTRAVNSQVCIRVSGKHNDLEEVGQDTYHLTLFEMLGNWSFGDFYKKEIITWSWELITERFGCPKDKLYATVYESDDEAATLWSQLTDINPEHILRFGKKDNFWEMADTGPCGPCSELHLDRGPDACDKKGVPGHVCQVNGDCARYIELWNLVFIQYERQKDGTLNELPHKHVDTGAGLERLVAYKQGTTSIYETDLFQPIIKTIEEISGIPYVHETGMPHRVLADHVRTISFALADNVIPSNEGRGYVIRRILRRGCRYAKKLGINEPVIYKLVAPLVAVMGDFFSQLQTRQDYLEKMIKAEEESFLRTLETGINLFDQLVEKLKSENKKIIPGAEVFKLYDTFGFPIDLTEIMAKEIGFEIDTTNFNTLLEKQRNQSRNARQVETPVSTEAAPIGGEARIAKDKNEKLQLARHHTGTHLLHAALREILGEHIFQAGSLVDLDRLRFDFSHFQALTKSELEQIEKRVNEMIKLQTPVEFTYKTLDDAKAMGAMALFGEKYEDEVRVVSIGDYSLELCGGNHCDNTSQIEQLKIISEAAISAGTRRIEAIAGTQNIEAYFNKIKKEELSFIDTKLKTLQKTLAQLKQINPEHHLALKQEALVSQFTDIESANYEELKIKRLEILELNKEAEKALAKSSNEKAGSQTEDLLARIKPINESLSCFYNIFEGHDLNYLRNVSDNLANARKNLIIMVGAKKEDKGFLLVKLAPEVDKSKFNAPELIKQLTAITGGNGGGRPDMAQAGGVNPQKIEEALSSVAKQLES